MKRFSASTPNPLVIDFEILRTAPPELNIAGIGDLLSIHTGTFDWEYAESKGKSEYPFSAYDVAKGRKILEKIYTKLDDIRKNTDEGLRTIVEGYMTVNTICLPLWLVLRQLQAGFYTVYRFGVKSARELRVPLKP